MGSERVRITVVLDAGPIIHLDQIDSLELLSAFDKLILPEKVHEEVSAGDMPSEMEKLELERVEAEDTEDFDNLDEGESSGLSIARNIDDVVFLTDDLEARQRAKELGIEVHGSVGVVAFGFRRGKLDFDEAADKMRALQEETDLFITDAVVERGIEMLEELSDN